VEETNHLLHTVIQNFTGPSISTKVKSLFLEMCDWRRECLDYIETKLQIQKKVKQNTTKGNITAQDSGPVSVIK
jgi:hypothetical protein